MTIRQLLTHSAALTCLLTTACFGACRGSTASTDAGEKPSAPAARVFYGPDGQVVTDSDDPPPAAPEVAAAAPAAPVAAAPVAAANAQPSPPPAPIAKVSMQPASPRPAKNTTSAVGTNLLDATFMSRDWIFLDAMKMAGPWQSRTVNSWEDPRKLPLDARGFPTKLEQDQWASMLLPTLGGGKLVLTYEGKGTILPEGIHGKLSIIQETAGRIVFDAERDNPMLLTISATDESDPLRNVRIVPVAYEKAAAVETFHPLFLERLEMFSVLRFMDWARTNASAMEKWENRSRADWYTQSAQHGIAYEYMILLCNTLHADMWITVPHKADDTFVKSLAKLIADNLAPDLKVWVEYSNEIWNDSPNFTQAEYSRQRGLELKLSRDPTEAKLRYQAKRSLEIFKVFEEVFGGSQRMVRVIGSQVGATYAHEALLHDPQVRKHTDALAVAPYFGHEIGSASIAPRVKKEPVSWILDTMEKGSLPEVIKAVRGSAGFAKKVGVDLVAYEGGQHIVAEPIVHDDPALAERLDASQRHPKMKALYLELLKAWKDAGGKTFAHFTFAAAFDKWGRFACLERMDQPRAEAPKYDALLEFIEKNPKWW